jgi:hypothetical protein
LIVVLFCVMCVVCVLCLIVVPLPPGENPFAVKINIYLSISSTKRTKASYMNTFPSTSCFIFGHYVYLQYCELCVHMSQRQLNAKRQHYGDKPAGIG